MSLPDDDGEKVINVLTMIKKNSLMINENMLKTPADDKLASTR